MESVGVNDRLSNHQFQNAHAYILIDFALMGDVLYFSKEMIHLHQPDDSSVRPGDLLIQNMVAPEPLRISNMFRI